MPVARHSILIYSLGRSVDIAKKGKCCTVSSFEHKKMTIENIKEVCKTFYSENGL